MKREATILVVGGIKGGSGKTTIATNLAVLRSQDKKVLFVDADEQKSASDWVEQRLSTEIVTNWTSIQLSGKVMYTELKKMSYDYDHIIIDTGGRDTTSQRSALLLANVFLIPFKPRSLDIWTLGSVRKLISEIQIINSKLQPLAIINQADAKGSDNKEAFDLLCECPEITGLQITIGHRKAFANAASEGLGVCELKNPDKKAIAEIKELHDTIYFDYT